MGSSHGPVVLLRSPAWKPGVTEDKLPWDLQAACGPKDVRKVQRWESLSPSKNIDAIPYLTESARYECGAEKGMIILRLAKLVQLVILKLLPHFLHSSVSGHLGYFHILALVSNATVNMGVLISL